MKLLVVHLRNIFFLSTVKNMVLSGLENDSLEMCLMIDTNHPEKLVQSFLIISSFFSSLWEETND